MTSRFVVSHVQEALAERKEIAGWLFYEYQGRNHTVLDLFGPLPAALSRRFWYWVPRTGEPVKLLHTVDSPFSEYFIGKTVLYSTWRELETALFSLLKRGQTIAMEYWPSALLPSQAILDASTKEWIEDQGVDIVSSWPLLAPLIGSLTPVQKDHFHKAVFILEKAFEQAWQWLAEQLRANQYVTEKDLQGVMTRVIHEEGAVFDSPPIIAAGVNSTIPHHCSENTPIRPDMIVLADAWCRLNDPNAPYADLSQVMYTGKKPPEIAQKVFSAVRTAQETAIEFIQTCQSYGCAIPGAEVDTACRNVVCSYGFGEYFTHRTGHNIYLSVHGPGANLDTYETRDSRHLIVNGCYSIEPGIYLPKAFGIRLECDIVIDSASSCSVYGRAPSSMRSLSL